MLVVNQERTSLMLQKVAVLTTQLLSADAFPPEAMLPRKLRCNNLVGGSQQTRTEFLPALSD